MDDEAMQIEDSNTCELKEDDLICNLKKAENAVKKLQEELGELKVTRTINKKQDATLAVSQIKEIELLAELKVLKQKKPSEIEICYPLIIELIKKHLLEQEQSLKQTLEVIDNESAVLKDEEQKFEQIIQEENHLINILQKELKEQDFQSKQDERKLEQLKRKLLKARTLRKQRMQETREFLQTYYPLPDRETLLKHVNKDQFVESTELNIMSLAELLELLLNTTLKKPYDSWIVIDDRMWPPYIELLLRYNIIVRHPEKCTLIKLETQLS